jgi:hypothetical protein
LGSFTEEKSNAVFEGNMAIGGKLEVKFGGMPSPVFIHQNPKYVYI